MHYALRALCLTSLILLIAPFFADATVPQLNRTLSFGMRGHDVLELQNTLIGLGHLAEGNATGYFGRLTEAAVQKYQCAQNIICTGSPATTGWGVVGPRTRLAILQGFTPPCCKTTDFGSLTASPTSGSAPLTVTFSTTGIDDSRNLYTIDLGDGSSIGGGLGMFSSPKLAGPPKHTYTSPGTYTAKLLQPSEVMTQCFGCPEPLPKVIGTVTITVTSSVAQSDVLFTILPQSRFSQLTSQQTHYLEPIKKNAMIDGVWLVTINRDAFKSRTTMTIPLPAGGFMTARWRPTAGNPPNTWESWSGTIDAPTYGDVLFTIGENDVAGSLRIGTENYSLNSLGEGLHVLTKPDPSKYGED